MDDAYLNGYAKLCGIYATGVYVSLCRHVDKEQKCFPSHEKIAEELNISRRQVIRSIDVLTSHNIISRERIGKKANNRYWLIDKSEWTDSHITNKSEVPTSHITSDSQSHHPVTHSHIHSKGTHIKGTHSKVATRGVAETVSEHINLFKNINPSYQRLFPQPPQRKAMERLLKDHGEDKVKEMIQFAEFCLGKKYAPTITTPYELEKNLAKLRAYYLKEKGSQLNKTIKI